MKKIRTNLIFAFAAALVGRLIVFTNEQAGVSGTGDRTFGILLSVSFGLLCFFIPEVILWIGKRRRRNRAARELRFLKKLFVISGSVKPVDFIRVIKKLIQKSDCHKDLLTEILEIHKRSDRNTESFYNDLMKRSDSVSVRLFCERLNMAANYDFEKAVKSISEDFIGEQREYARFVKKKIELIHIIGVVGMFLLITILVIWLLGPWMEMLSKDGFM